MNQICCFTGHRDLPAHETVRIRHALRSAVLQAVADGYTHFLCGYASGADLLFASVVAALKPQLHITLEAVIPYMGRMRSRDALFQSLLLATDRVKIHASAYDASCFMRRNRSMVEQSGRVIAVHDGRAQGGTAATLRYAQKLAREIVLIPVEKPQQEAD